MDHELLHRRLGHVHQRAIQKTIEMARGVKLKNNDEVENCICEACVMGKLTRGSFRKQWKNRIQDLFGRIHSDVCGPMRTVSFGGKKCFVTFMDEASGHVRVYLLKTKDQVFERLKEFCTEMKNLFGIRPKRMRMDGGGEYSSKEMEEWLRRKGIFIERTAKHTPQQNGKSERLNRTLLSMARSLLFQAGLPKRFWGEAIICATYLRNRVHGGSAPKGKTPYEAMWNETPDLSHLRVFGCLAYAKVTAPGQCKLEPRAIKCIFLGYANEKKGYRLLDIARQKIVVASYGDVIFEETVFPEKDKALRVQPSLSASPTPELKHATLTPEIPLSILSPAAANTRPKRQWNPSNKSLENFARITIEELCFGTYDEPRTEKEAMEGDEWVPEHWKAAMESEKKSIFANKTWSDPIVPKKQPVKARWVFRKKVTVQDGKLLKYKARLVAKGLTQKYGIDYRETFAPVAAHTTIRVLLAVAAHLDLNLYHLDVDTAFLNGDLDEEIFLELPPGFALPGEKVVVKLLKSLYGLKQASRQWNKKLHPVLIAWGFLQSLADPCLYVFHNQTDFVILVVYVDDFIGAANSSNAWQKLVTFRSKTLDSCHMPWVGELRGIGRLKGYLLIKRSI